MNDSTLSQRCIYRVRHERYIYAVLLRRKCVHLLDGCSGFSNNRSTLSYVYMCLDVFVIQCLFCFWVQFYLLWFWLYMALGHRGVLGWVIQDYFSITMTCGILVSTFWTIHWRILAVFSLSDNRLYRSILFI